jgi:methylated-DNA-[protein]-cysteine S-methyltransferase
VRYQLSKSLSLMSRTLTREYPAPRFERDKDLFKTLQQQITAYFEGFYVSFGSDVHVALDRLSPFARSVLTACRTVEFGRVVTYSELAKKLERPGAARAVGNALAKNPLPLIIPCHRVVRSDGKIGGFSAPGGIDLKAKLLEHEQASLLSRISPN